MEDWRRISMELGEKGATYMSLPYNMQTPQNQALGIMFDKQMKKLIEYFKKVLVWGDTDNAEVTYYGAMAKSIRSLFYDSNESEDVKRAIIKDALKFYAFAGTEKAEIELIHNIFGEGEIKKWFDYNGEPYHFKIQIDESSDQEKYNRVSDILKRVKAARSILDAIETKKTANGNINIGIGAVAYVYNAPVTERKG
jgi:phage tail P2-like protein